MHGSLHSHVASPPAPRQDPLGAGALVEAGDHHTSPALALMGRWCSVLVSCVGAQTPSPRQGQHLAPSWRGESHWDGAAPEGVATEQTLTLCKLPVLHHRSFIHLALSEPGKNTDTATTPGLRDPRAAQTLGCSGHPSCNPAKQKLYNPPRSWGGTAMLWQTPCAAAWRGHKEAAIPGTSSAFWLRTHQGHTLNV